MNSGNKIISGLLLVWSLCMSPLARADADEGYLHLCLKAWGQHPFKDATRYRKYSSVVNVFGIGQNTDDLAPTREPELVLIDSAVNVMGGTTIRLINPNGWYCFRSNTNVMGKVTIRAHCKAHIASAEDGLTFLGEDQHNKSTTVMGLTHIDLLGCDVPDETRQPAAEPEPSKSKPSKTLKRRSRAQPEPPAEEEDY
jgi:hypothetical protein